MKRFIPILVILLTYLTFSCKTKNNTDQKKKKLEVTNDTVSAKVQQTEHPSIPDFSINQPFFADTKKLKERRKRIFKNFINTVAPAGPEYDTLVDINYDGYRDYILDYYGLAGTGFKYRIKAYIFSKKKGDYFLNRQISNLVNPSFFISKHKITSFYIGLGGGGGSKLEWKKNRWILTKEFDVDNQGDSTIWEINYQLTKRKEYIKQPFHGIPPENILESNDYF